MADPEWEVLGWEILGTPRVGGPGTRWSWNKASWGAWRKKCGRGYDRLLARQPPPHGAKSGWGEALLAAVLIRVQ